MAVADASLSTEKDSISFGLMVDKIPREPPTLSLDIGNPSITINGSLEALIDEPPRILIVAPEPGAPPSDVIFTPATLPLSRLSGVTILPLVKSFAVTDSTDPVASLTVVVPYPTRTISSN